MAGVANPAAWTMRSLAMGSLWAAVLSLCAGCGDDAAPRNPADLALPAADALNADGADASVSDAQLPADAPSTQPGCPGQQGCACDSDEACDDGNPCTYGGACADGHCTAGFAETCDDGDACSLDTCTPVQGCVHTLSSGPCQDGDACTVGDACKDDVCVPGKIRTCDDGNECTDDSCSSGVGCTYTHNEIACKDGNICLETSYCQDGGCVPGKWKPCDDGIACTYDTCDPVDGCTFGPVPLPAPCTGSAVEKWGRCAQAFPVAGTWAQARKACQVWGGELASVRGIEENAWLRQVADAGCGKDAAAWIGATDAVQEGAWRWSDASHVRFGHWAGGEPNNAGNEDYAQMLGGGAWNDSDGGAAPCRICARPVSTNCDDAGSCTVGATCAGGACLPGAQTRDCDDDNVCTLDACATGSGCVHQAVAAGTACGVGGVCGVEGCILPEALGIPNSCLAIAKATPQGPSGVYWLDPDGAGAAEPFQAWCDLHGDGGGWTLVLKLDGADPKTNYDAPLWTDSLPINSASFGLGAAAAKLASFWTMPLTELRVGLRRIDKDTQADELHWIVLPLSAPSLRAAFAIEKATPSTLGLFAWESLLSDASLQPFCLDEGINVQTSSGAAVRVGIVGNNEADCGSVDSWLGLGGRANICGNPGTPTTGNLACWNPDHGDRTAPRWGYLMVR